jgi:uncharacterized membrane protein
MMMIKSIEEYLDQLRTQLKDSDAATIRDALADAEEHIRVALAISKQEQPEMSEEEALDQIIEQYGDPSETASAYREVERRTAPSLMREEQKQGSWFAWFFGVYADPRAWGALLYMLIAFVTGVLYFTWAVTGLSLSVSFLIFIFGFPFAILFLLSVHGLIFIEGRLVEALLGVRMPRRPIFTEKKLKWLERLKQLLTDRRTWLSIVYMVIQFALGTVYFVLIVTVLSFSLASIAIPFVQEFFHEAPIQVYDARYAVPTWSYPLFILGGFLLWTTFMNIARGVGQLHGRMAKAMLVTD